MMDSKPKPVEKNPYTSNLLKVDSYEEKLDDDNDDHILDSVNDHYDDDMEFNGDFAG